MRVGKLKSIFSFIFIIFASGVMFACGGKEPGKLKFLQNEIIMQINDEIKIGDYIELENLAMGDVTFLSSNSNVVFVKEGANNEIVLVALSEGVATITANGIENEKITIVVEGAQNLNFDVPKNIRFDERNGEITWDAVYLNNTIANYQVKLTRNGEIVTDIPEVVTQNKISIWGEGEFTFSVACAKNGIINASDFSDIFTFKKLSAPTNLIYNDQTKLLTWQSAEGVNNFRVVINGVASEVLSVKEYSISFESGVLNEIYVMSCATENEENVYGAFSENKISITKLNAPEIKIQEGVVSWEDKSGNALSYNLTISGTNINETISKNSSGKYSYVMTGVSQGAHIVNITAMGDGESGNLSYDHTKHYLNSETASLSVVKLEKYELKYDILNNEIYVVSESGELYNPELGQRFIMTIVKDGGAPETLAMDEGKYRNYDFSSAGTYTISVVNTFINSNEINSDSSEEIAITKLPQVVGATQKIDNGKYYVENFEVVGGTSYIVELVGESTTILSNENNTINTLFERAGEYIVRVTAHGTNSKNSYFLSSETVTNLKVVKPNDLELSLDEANTQIKWNSACDFATVAYACEILDADNKTIEQKVVTQTYFNYSHLGVGKYYLKAYATMPTNTMAGTTLILDSANISTIEFNIIRPLHTPNVRTQITDTQNILIIDPVDGATEYVVSCDGESMGKATKDGDIYKIDITNKFDTDGMSYVFSVVAKNPENNYYQDSEPRTITVTKQALTSPTISAVKQGDRRFLNIGSVAGANTYIVYCNGEPLEPVVQDGTGYKVEITNIFKNDGTGENASMYRLTVVARNTVNKYYLDSNPSEVLVSKQTLANPSVSVQKQQDKYFLNIVPVDGAVEYTVSCNNTPMGVATQDGSSYKIEITNKFITNDSEYSFKIVAKNTDNKYYLESAPTTVLVRRATAPTSFKVTATGAGSEIVERVTSTFDAGWFDSEGIVVKINGVLTNDLNHEELRAATIYNLEINYIPKLYSGGVYYIDSPASTFTVKRITTTIDINNEKITVGAKESVTGETKRLIIADGTNTEIRTLNQNIFDLTTLKGLGFDLNNSISVSLQYVISNLTGTSDGELDQDNNYINGYISSHLNSIAVQYANAEMDINAQEVSDAVKITWNKKSSAEYKIGGADVTELAKSAFESGRQNYLSLEEILDNQRNVYLFTITRVSDVAQITVLADETISVPTTGLPTGVRELKVSQTSLSALESGELNVTAQYLAKEKTTEKPYEIYLNGNVSEFTFKRLSKHEELNVDCGAIVWKNPTGEPSYETRAWIYDNSDPAITHALTVSVSEDNTSGTSSIDIDQFIDLLHALPGSERYFKLMKVVSDFTARPGLNYISSDISELEFNIMPAITNVKIEADINDLSQEKITISWDAVTGEFDFTKYYIKVVQYNEKDQIVSTNEFSSNSASYEVEASDIFFKSAGRWEVSVMVEGTKSTISSPYCQATSITRLSLSNSVSVSKNGLISWEEVDGADGYVVEYSNNFKTYITNVLSTTTYQISSEELAELFATLKTATIKVYAIGNGTSSHESGTGTLSSVSEITFKQLETPIISFDPTGIVFDNYEEFAGATLLLTGKINGRLVLNESIKTLDKDELGNYKLELPSNFAYLDDGTSVDQNVQNEIVFSVYATSQIKNTIDSNTATNSAIKLANLSNIYFQRDVNDMIHLIATSVNTSLTPSVYVKMDASTDIYNTKDIDIEITDEILSSLSDSWTISFQALGYSLEDVGSFLDSAITSISGTKLAPVASIKANEHQFEWDNVFGAIDYRVVLNESETLSGYALTNKMIQSMVGDSFDAGEYKVKIKTVGNVGASAVTENVVLDSQYSSNFDIIKLEQILDINITNGFFTFTMPERADVCYIELYETLNGNRVGEYVLQTAENIFGDGKTYYSNSSLITLMERNQKEYYAKFYVKSSTAGSNCLYSDYSKIDIGGNVEDYIIISTLAKPQNKISLYNPTISGTSNKNYYTTIGRMGIVDENLHSGFLLTIDGETTHVTNSEFTLDNDGTWDAGEHKLSYRQVGSTGFSDERKSCLTGNASETLSVRKLEAPIVNAGTIRTTTGKIEMVFNFTTMDPADLYTAYFDDVPYKTYGAPSRIDTTDLTAGEYQYLYVKSASKTLGVLASSEGYLKYDGEIAKIKKLNTAQTSYKYFECVDGTLRWKFDDSSVLNFVMGSFIENPLALALSIINNISLTFKFESIETGAIYEYSDCAYNFCYISENQFTKVENGVFGALLKPYIDQLKKKLGQGFPGVNYGFNDFAKNLPVGEYKISVQQLGSYRLTDTEGEGETAKTINTMVVSSNYTNLVARYVGGAPEISVENNDGTYYVRFNNVAVKESYVSSENPSYNLVGIYTDEEGVVCRKLIAGVTANGFNNSERLEINITELIQYGALDHTFSGLYVYMAGNNSTMLNGKCSNVIDITPLRSIVATAERGVIKWTAQPNATKYVLRYDLWNDADQKYDVRYVEFDYEEGRDTYTWEGEGLQVDKDYIVYITAYGSKEQYASKNNANVIISGPETAIGTISKFSQLQTININYGIFEWDAVANNCGYDVFYSQTALTTFSGDYSHIVDSSYETEVNNNGKYFYYFRTVGSTLSELSGSSRVYLTSIPSVAIEAQRVASVDSVRMQNGIVLYDSLGTGIQYKLILNKIDNGVAGDNIYIYNKNESNVGTLYFNTNDDIQTLASGNYTISIQACYEERTATAQWSNVYYLISSRNKLEYEKFPTVEKIQVKDGIISWQYDGPTPADEYHFDLTFVYNDVISGDDVVKTIKVNPTLLDEAVTNVYAYEGIIFEENIGSDTNIALSIIVAPGKADVSSTDLPMAISVSSGYVNEAGEFINIHQFNKINEDSLVISLLDNNRIKIEWQGEDDGFGNEKYTYEVWYKATTGEEGTLKIDRAHFIVGGEGSDITLNIQEEYGLNYRIRIIPTEDNYISSAWTQERTIQRLKPITGLEFDDVSDTFTWEAYADDVTDVNRRSIFYQIKDEVGTYEGGVFNPTKGFIIDAELGDEKYTPFVIGHHRISIMVVMKNANGEGFTSDYYTDTEIRAVDLYEAGEGTNDLPYLISNAEQFANMKHRLSKDAKNNEYYLGSLVGGTIQFTEQKQVEYENKYFFKQIAHLELGFEHAISDDYGDDKGINNAVSFNGAYDGDYYKLSFVWNNNLSNTQISNISIFERLGEGAILQNINLLFTLSVKLNKSATISVLTRENLGTIKNILIGNKGEIFEMREISQPVATMSFITNINYGTISEVVNLYNVYMSQSTSMSASITFASITNINETYAIIQKCKNVGNITMNASFVNIGGVVVQTKSGAEVVGCVNNGNINVFIQATDGSLATRIGGLIAQNDGGLISYSYSACDISVAGSGILNDTYVGGLIGSSSGLSMHHTYSNVTRNENVSQGATAFDTIYQVIGRLSGNVATGEEYNGTNYYKDKEDFLPIPSADNSQYTVFAKFKNSLTEASRLYSDEAESGQEDLVFVSGTAKLRWEASFDSIDWRDLIS